MIVLPVQLYLLIIGGMILLDTYYGVYAKIKTGEKFNWLKFFKGLRFKLALYTPAMVGIFWFDTFILNELILKYFNFDLLITHIGCVVLSSTEIASINKNYKVITGKSLYEKCLDFYKFLKKLNKKYKKF